MLTSEFDALDFVEEAIGEAEALFYYDSWRDGLKVEVEHVV